MFWHPGAGKLSLHLDGMLRGRSAAALEAHLLKCPPCAEKLEALRGVKAALRNLPAPEGRRIKEPPFLLPVASPATVLLWKAVAVSLIALILGIRIATLWPVTPALKVISGTSQVISSEGLVGSRVTPDSTLQTLPPGNVDLEIPNQVLLRLKPGTTITWQQVRSGFFQRQPHIQVSLMRGEMVARTQESFWGSELEVRTPSATATVKGTAFSMKIDPQKDKTSLKVLTGSVFFSPHMGRVGVNVEAGQTSQLYAERLPMLPRSLTIEERNDLLEAYRIGQDPLIALVIGGGPERVGELLKPAMLYLSVRNHPKLQPALKELVQELNAALLNGGPVHHIQAIRILENSLSFVSDEELAVPLHLFVGAFLVRLGDAQGGLRHFQLVAEGAPRNPHASLALAAAAVVYESQLSDPGRARENYRRILSRYPRSPEAQLAREFLLRHPR
ncbi:MAG: FecR domain-containing protein [Candidatus Omnitrophica bacterium]|nr:FecR domain-containing protein [Candidatus Omnitrophota bacterium]